MFGLDVKAFLNLSQLDDLDAMELCDALWLAKYMKTDKKYYLIQEKKIEDEKEPTNQPNNKGDTLKKPPIESEKPKASTLSIEDDTAIALSINDSNSFKNSSFRIGHHGYFEHSKSLSTFLKGFKEKEKSRKKRIFDEDKTVNYIASTNIKQVFFIPKKVKKYELYIVVDSYDSMRVWEEMIDVYRRLLINSGVFKAVKTLYMNQDENKMIFFKDREQKSRYSLKEISNIHKNKLFLVLSDMQSKVWSEGDAFLQFYNLHKNISLFMVQMLPYRLWKSTALHRASITKLKSKKNYPLHGDYSSEMDNILQKLSSLDRKDIKLPIVSFELASLKTVGNSLQAKEEKKIDGIVINLNQKIEQQSEDTKSSQMIDNFFANASKEAQKLMISLSAVPLNMPIMRMIQEKVLNDRKNIYLAEVLNSKLLVKNGEFFEFINKDVNDELYNLLGKEVALEIAYSNSDYIQENLNAKFGFKALLSGEVDLTNIDFSKNEKIFASISCRILKSLGTKYTQKAGCSGKKETQAIIPKSKRFQMGSNEYDDEKPIHEIVINYDFEIAQYPVTVGEFRVFIEDTGYKTQAEREGGAYIWDGTSWEMKKDAYWDNPYFEQSEENPVVCVSWIDAKAYCKWFSAKTGEFYRLPTEAEWEYSCRAGTTTKWSFGDDEKELTKYAWYNDNSDHKTHPVGEKEPTPWGLYDMHGNVWEWCEDDYVKNYHNTPRDGTAHVDEKADYKILRGGSWSYDDNNTRSALRIGYNPVVRNFLNGFRLLRTLPSELGDF